MKNVWNIYVGKKGDSLPILNQRSGPFPPNLNDNGLVAIGWPDVGNMFIYKDRYHDFLYTFNIAYKNNRPQTAATTANILWNFAYEMKIEDIVICPSSASGFILIGSVISDYKFNIPLQQSLPRTDLIHFREVVWKCIIPANSILYKKLNKAGQFTMSTSKYSYKEIVKLIKNVDRLKKRKRNEKI